MDSGLPEIPDYLKDILNNELFERLLVPESTLPLFELSLFRWHAEETEALHQRMHAEELAYINEQIAANQDELNDSGMLTVEYFYKRIRYSDVVHLVSLLESALDAACNNLRLVLPPDSMLFDLKELQGNKWEVRRMFLERYGRFNHPTELWKPVKLLIRIRNSIVHDNGSTHSLNANDKKALAGCKGLDVSAYWIDVKFEYVKGAVDDLEKLINYYEENVRQAIDRIE